MLDNANDVFFFSVGPTMSRWHAGFSPSQHLYIVSDFKTSRVMKKKSDAAGRKKKKKTVVQKIFFFLQTVDAVVWRL